MATTSNLVTIKDAIVWAHDEMHNRHALTEKECEKLGIAKQAFDQWSAYVEELRLDVKDYLKVTQAQDAVAAFNTIKDHDIKAEKTEDKVVEVVTGRVWSAWKSVLKNGTAEEFNKNFFLRKADLTMIAGYCGMGKLNTAVGPQFTPKQAADFRKHVEMCIGIRMTGNGMIDDADRDLIQAYEGALKTIKSSNDALNDTKAKNGQTVAGLRSQLLIATKKLEDQDAVLTGLGIEADKKAVILEELTAKRDGLEAAVTEAEKRLEDAEKTKADNEEKYNKVIALLKSVGDFK